MASRRTRVSLLSELLRKKELIERMHPISEDLTVEEVMDLKVRMCWPTRCVIWLYILVYLVQSANAEFKSPIANAYYSFKGAHAMFDFKSPTESKFEQNILEAEKWK